MTRLQGMVAVVTGGASGLGAAIAERLATDGATVVITDLNATAGEQTAAAHGWHFLQHDVTDEEQWQEIITTVEESVGALTILVNNAGIVGPQDAVTPEDSRLEDWQQIFSVNVTGVFLGCRTAIPAMRRAGTGTITNISSVAGLLATPYATAYGASKAAVRQLTKSVAQHCVETKLRVRCNSIHPGDMLTPLWERLAAELAIEQGGTATEILAEEEALIPLGEFTLPEDVAALVSFLSSDEAKHITGAKFVIDGGILDCDTFLRSAAGRQRLALLPRLRSEAEVG